MEPRTTKPICHGGWVLYVARERDKVAHHAVGGIRESFWGGLTPGKPLPASLAIQAFPFPMPFEIKLSTAMK